MSNIPRILISSIFLLHIVGLASSAIVHGTVYEWYTLAPLQDVIVDVNSTPPQRFVAKEGVYRFELEEGEYCIKARYYEDNEFIYYSEENVSVVSEGEFVIDLIMLPGLDLNESFMGNPYINLSVDEDLLEDIGGGDDGELIFWVALAVIIISLVSLYFLKFRRNTEGGGPSRGMLPDDLGKIIAILERNDGRMTQLELRGELHYSEAKVSLMLADLENQGLIRKFKRGRGNVIILVKPD